MAQEDSIHSHIKPGAPLTLHGKSFHVLGSVMYALNGTEWDEEDNAFAPYTCVYTEWLLDGSDASENREYYLAFEENEFFFGARKKTTTAPPSTQTTTLSIIPAQGTQKIIARGTTKVVMTNGETEGVQKKEQWGFAEYEKENTYFGIEWDISNPNNVYTYQDEVVSESEILNGLGLNQIIEQREVSRAQEKKKFGELSLWGWLMIFAGAGLLGTALVGPKLGTTLFQKSIPLTVIGSTDEKKDVIVGPIALTKPGRTYTVEFKTLGMRNQSIYIEMALLDKNKKAINAFEKELWHETGVEGGESYSEDSGDFRHYFTLEKAGSYYLQTTFQKPKNTTATENFRNPNAYVHIAVKENVLVGWQYGIAGGVLAALGFLYVVIASRRKKRFNA